MGGGSFEIPCIKADGSDNENHWFSHYWPPRSPVIEQIDEIRLNIIIENETKNILRTTNTCDAMYKQYKMLRKFLLETQIALKLKGQDETLNAYNIP